jgi:DNA-binding PadR family transcriptional regulator
VVIVGGLVFSPELKKGSIELLALSLLEGRPRHGYEIGKLIALQSGGRLSFAVSALYPTLYRMEKKGWTKGRWVEKQGQRRRYYYTLTQRGRAALAERRENWQEFVAAVGGGLDPKHA